MPFLTVPESTLNHIGKIILEKMDDHEWRTCGELDRECDFGWWLNIVGVTRQIWVNMVRFEKMDIVERRMQNAEWQFRLKKIYAMHD